MNYFSIAAAFMFTGIAAGAFGAHGLKNYFSEFPYYRDIFEKAVFYQLIHSLALLVLPTLGEKLSGTFWRASAGFFLAGILLFSGSLYILSLTRIKWLGAITPFGGFAFLIGWFLIFINALKRS